MRQAFTLIEVALTVTIGLVILGASVYGYNQVKASSNFSSAKSMVGTVQTNIGMDKFRTGPAPTLSQIQSNTDSVGKPYWTGTATGTFPNDPVTGHNTVFEFTSGATPVPLATGAPTTQYDNPIFNTPTATASPGYGGGGWLYDPITGAFRINLSNQAYPDQKPGAW